MARGPRTVWVLGSGFSKSLGGPLLNELISSKTAEETREVFPALGTREIVYYLYSQHPALWSHAEEFLDYIDTALQASSPRRKIFERHLQHAAHMTIGAGVNVGVEEFRDQAILTVAAECSTYTHNVDTRAEAWQPYRRWVSQRGAWDTIITFNYDLVLEQLMNQQGPIAAESFVRPGRAPLAASNSAAVLKVHGSVDWGLDAHGVVKTVNTIEDFTKGVYRPLIATPGATKSNYCNQHLRTLWDAVAYALREAEVVVFLGYRFPPSDSEARERILKGLADNKVPRLTIHTVLGPKIHDDATVRLNGLLKHTLEGAGREPLMSPEGYEIINEPLYVEDFLSVLKPPALRATAPGQ